MGDVWVLLRDWKLLGASLTLAACLGLAIALPPFVNAEPVPRVSLADPVAPYAGLDADQLRVDDLAWLARTLDSYARVWASYPETRDPSPVCSRLADVTCMLWTSEPSMFASDGKTPYYYRSDGQTFTLFALMDYRSPRTCAEEAPPGWDRARTYCVVGVREPTAGHSDDGDGIDADPPEFPQ